MGVKGTAFDFTSFLLNTATIETRTDTSDAMMGVSTSWATSYAAEPCSLQGYTGQSSFVEKFGKAQESTTHVAIFQRDLTIHDGDRLTDENGKKYLILGATDEGGTGEVFTAYLRHYTEV